MNTGTGKDDAGIVPGIGKEAAVIISSAKAQKGKSKISEILQGKSTELVVGGDDDLSESGSVSNAMAAKHGIKITLKLSVKNCMHLECLFSLINCHDFFHLKGVLNNIVQTNKKSDEKWVLYKTNLAGYKHYFKTLNILKHTRDGLNVALILVEHAEYDNIDEDELATMGISAPKHQNTG